MADKTFVMRLALENGEVVVRGLDEIGDKGEAAARKIRRAAEVEASPGLRAMTTATNEAQRGIEELASRAGTLGTVLSSIGPAGILVAAGIGAATIAVRALASAALEANERLDQLGDSAERLDVGVQFLSQWSAALQAAGGDGEQFVSTLQGFQEKIGAFLAGAGGKGVDKALDSLGLTPEALRRAGDLESQLLLIAGALEQVESKAERAGIADKLGLSALFPLLDLGKEKLAGLVGEYESLGRATADAADKAGPIQTEIDNASARIDAASTVIAQRFAPALSTAIGLMARFVEISAGIGPAMDKISRLQEMRQRRDNITEMNNASPFLQAFTGYQPVSTAELDAAIEKLQAEIDADARKALEIGSLPLGTIPLKLNTVDVPDAPVPGAVAVARKAETDAARELAAAERLLLEVKGKGAQLDAKLREQIEGLTRARELGVIATDAEYDALVRQATARVDVERNAWLTDANKQAIELVETLKTADFTTEGVNARFDAMGRILSGNVTTLDDLLSVLTDVVAQLARAAAMGAANNEGSFWSLFGDGLAGLLGLGGGSATSISSLPTPSLPFNIPSPVGVGHTGMIVGGEGGWTRMTSMSTFVGAPRFHTGGLLAGEVPIIAQRGEGIFTPKQMDNASQLLTAALTRPAFPAFDPAQLMALAGGGGGGRERAAAPVVNIMPTVTNNTGQPIETETKTSQDSRGNVTIETVLKPMVKQAQRENVRSGSMDKAMTERSGVRPRLRPV